MKAQRGSKCHKNETRNQENSKAREKHKELNYISSKPRCVFPSAVEGGGKKETEILNTTGK